MTQRIVFSVLSRLDPDKKDSKVYFSRVVEVSGILINRVPYDNIIDSLNFLFTDVPHIIDIKISERE